MSISIPSEKLREIEQAVLFRVRVIVKAFGNHPMKSININGPDHYMKMELLDSDDRRCQYILHSFIIILLDFRKVLMQSNDLDETALSQPKESSLLPLSELDYSGLKKTFILTDDDLSSFIQTQHVYINELLRIKNNPEVLRNDFNRMGLSDFKAFSQDTMFLWFQKSQVVRSILEALDIQITKEDEVGRITDIHYDD